MIAAIEDHPVIVRILSHPGPTALTGAALPSIPRALTFNPRNGS
jgi:hypothetical protein